VAEQAFSVEQWTKNQYVIYLPNFSGAQIVVGSDLLQIKQKFFKNLHIVAFLSIRIYTLRPGAI
jgi:hypothetical protein